MRKTAQSNPAAKLGKRRINRSQITPLKKGQSGVITLPPITQSASSGAGNGIAAGSKVPSFSASIKWSSGISPEGTFTGSVSVYTFYKTNYYLLGNTVENYI